MLCEQPVRFILSFVTWHLLKEQKHMMPKSERAKKMAGL